MISREFITNCCCSAFGHASNASGPKTLPASGYSSIEDDEWPLNHIRFVHSFLTFPPCRSKTSCSKGPIHRSAWISSPSTFNEAVIMASLRTTTYVVHAACRPFARGPIWSPCYCLAMRTSFVKFMRRFPSRLSSSVKVMNEFASATE